VIPSVFGWYSGILLICFQQLNQVLLVVPLVLTFNGEVVVGLAVNLGGLQEASDVTIRKDDVVRAFAVVLIGIGHMNYGLELERDFVSGLRCFAFKETDCFSLNSEVFRGNGG